MNQPSDISDLIAKAGLDDPSTITKPTPYHSGHPVDSIPDVSSPPLKQQESNKKLQELVGYLNWISTQTCPDISTITNILAQYNHKCSPGHIKACKYAIHYLKGTALKGIKFSSRQDHIIESFVQFPLNNYNPSLTQTGDLKMHPSQIHPTAQST